MCTAIADARANVLKALDRVKNTLKHVEKTADSTYTHPTTCDCETCSSGASLTLLGLRFLEIAEFMKCDMNRKPQRLAHALTLLWVDYIYLDCPPKLPDGVANVWKAEIVLKPSFVRNKEMSEHLAEKGMAGKGKKTISLTDLDSTIAQVADSAYLYVLFTLWDEKRDTAVIHPRGPLMTCTPFLKIAGRSPLAVLALKLAACMPSAFTGSDLALDEVFHPDEASYHKFGMAPYLPNKVITHDQTIADLLLTFSRERYRNAGAKMPIHGGDWTTLPHLNCPLEHAFPTSTATRFIARAVPLGTKSQQKRRALQRVCVCSGCGKVGVQEKGQLAHLQKMLRCSLCQVAW